MGYESIIMLDWVGRELEHPKVIKVHKPTGQSSYNWWLKTELYESAITKFYPLD